MNRSGMTLMELVVGLTISGLVLSVGYAAFHSVLDHRERADEVTGALARAATQRRTLVSWLAGARLTVEEGGPEFRGLDGVEGEAWRMPDDELSFLTNAPTPLGSGHTIVRLSIDRDEDTPERGLVAELREWRGLRTERVEIEPGAAGLDLQYLSGIGGERRWLPSWISSSVLPLGVQLSLVPPQGDSLPPMLRLPVLVPLGGGR